MQMQIKFFTDLEFQTCDCCSHQEKKQMVLTFKDNSKSICLICARNLSLHIFETLVEADLYDKLQRCETAKRL